VYIAGASWDHADALEGKSNMTRNNSIYLPDTATAFHADIHHHLKYSLGKTRDNCSQRELFMAVVLAVRDRLVDQMLETEKRYRQADVKRLYYLSMEFLIGRSLDNNLTNLWMMDLCREVLGEMGLNLEDVLDSEEDAALGNGGLGRLAACFLDSLATLHMPGYGYGINYEYGLFKQVIENGYQKEQPDVWLPYGSPWLIKRPDEASLIPLYGRIERGHRRSKPRWVDYKIVIGVPHDMPIVGFGGRTVNVLRLYSAKSSHEFDMQVFNRGDYLKAMEQKIASETISKVLYPSDSVDAGRELRLVQEYFLVACAIGDIIKSYLENHDSFDAFPAKVAIQLNDTHPALAVVEFMRRLIDEHDLPWDKAWEITQATLAYTNHTLLPEALETWPVSLFEYVLPRHLQLIYQINDRFLRRVAAVWPEDLERLQRMSIVGESEHKQIRMAHLAIVGSHSVNGVSELHSKLVQTTLVPDFYQLWPERFNNKTNGVTQRRWLLKANPRLAELITTTIGDGWITNLDEIKALEPYADDETFQRAFMDIKHANKEHLTKVIKDTTGVSIRPESLFDIHVKRIHEYKRQSLNVLHIIHTYLSIIEDHKPLTVPRTFILAGKAAPEYWAAKQIIKLIHNVAQVINNDPRVEEKVKVVFIPDYRVSLAEKIFPAADLSEQISTAGMEASGTGNMKFALNGALTIGTLDGANIEIREEVGKENIFIFGLRAEEIHQMQRQQSYHPRDYYHRNPYLKRVMDALHTTMFCPREPGLFDWFYEAIMDHGDYYFHLADLESYIDTQEMAAQEYTTHTVWARKAILNVALMGKFSSDRTIREYASDIWKLQPV
jgi:starch phosphorylase